MPEDKNSSEQPLTKLQVELDVSNKAGRETLYFLIQGKLNQLGNMHHIRASKIAYNAILEVAVLLKQIHEGANLELDLLKNKLVEAQLENTKKGV